MKRRDFLIQSGMSICSIGLSSLWCQKNKTKTKPNLLFVFADQFRRQAMGFMKEDPVITPNFNRFATESVVFTHAISAVSICSPFRAMLMTSRFPLSTGIVGNCKAGISYELSEKEICLSDVLSNNEYQTGYIGKWHLECPGLNKSKTPPGNPTGGDAWTFPGPRRHGFDLWYAYNTGADHFHPHYWADSTEKIQVHEWSAKHETDIAIEFMEKRDRDRPFALFMSWYPPHPDFEAPQEYLDLYHGRELPLRPNAKETKNRLPYFAAITSLDDQFRRLLDFLEKEDLSDNTIVVFTSDHGEMMQSHADMGKDIWYEESIGIPFLIRWPQRLTPRKTDMLFACYDFMPTLLGLMAIPVPETVEGRDYSTTLFGQSNEEPSSAFIAHYALPAREHFSAVGQAPNKSVKFAKSVQDRGVNWQDWGFRGLRTKRYTYVVDRTPEGIEGYSVNDEQEKPYRGSTLIRVTRLLYDNENDPYQLAPIKAVEADEHPVIKKLDQELQRWLDKMNDKFPL
jgi:arylsulfatase A-like enzyme